MCACPDRDLKIWNFDEKRKMEFITDYNKEDFLKMKNYIHQNFHERVLYNLGTHSMDSNYFNNPGWDCDIIYLKQDSINIGFALATYDRANHLKARLSFYILPEYRGKIFKEKQNGVPKILIEPLNCLFFEKEVPLIEVEILDINIPSNKIIEKFMKLSCVWKNVLFYKEEWRNVNIYQLFKNEYKELINGI